MSFDETAIVEEVLDIQTSTTYLTSSKFEKIAEIVAKTANCKIEDVKLESDLESLGLVSLDTITALFDLEEAFDVEIPNDEISSISTVSDILETLEKVT